MSPCIRNSLKKKKNSHSYDRYDSRSKTNLREKQEERKNYMLPQTFFVILLSASIYVEKGKYQTK
jgi:hypothetical protein